jgi:hypothetical protein
MSYLVNIRSVSIPETATAQRVEMRSDASTMRAAINAVITILLEKRNARVFYRNFYNAEKQEGYSAPKLRVLLRAIYDDMDAFRNATRLPPYWRDPAIVVTYIPDPEPEEPKQLSLFKPEKPEPSTRQARPRRRRR